MGPPCILPYVPPPLADVNLCPFTINHDLQYDGNSDFCESFQKIMEAVDCLGNPQILMCHTDLQCFFGAVSFSKARLCSLHSEDPPKAQRQALDICWQTNDKHDA